MKNFKVITMPGGEQHVTFTGDPNNPPSAIRVEGIVTADKLIAAGMAVEIVSRLRSGLSPSLVLPYLPGARQDRIQDPCVGFSADVYASVINSFNIWETIVLDPHSEEARSTLEKYYPESIRVIPHQDWFLRWIESTTFSPGPHKFLFPDAGAAKKYGQVSSYSPHLSCTKKRDPITGQLSGFEVPDIHSWEDNFIWIIDDICDGGGTFIAVAEEIRRQLGNKCKLGLAVSHGIFSKGIGDLYSLFDYIVTTDSVYEGQFGKAVSVQPLEPILKEMGINV